MRISSNHLRLLTGFLLALSLISTANYARSEQQQTLKKKFTSDFTLGITLGNHHLVDPSEQLLNLVATEFNALTAENAMKWANVNPQPGKYDFSLADKLVNIGLDNDMFIVGHALVWHQQTPDWVFEDDEGNPLSRDALLARMKQHIHTVLGHFRGKVDGWDVVNEALEEDGSMRKSKWQQIIGDDFVFKAFEYARQADPEIELYYNDYGLTNRAKREGAIRLVKDLISRGARVDGIGIQGHFSIDYPTLQDLQLTLTELGDLGPQIMITELDVSVLPFPEQATQGADVSQDFALNQKYNPYAEGLPQNITERFNSSYVNFFKLFLEHRDKISRVTFWGVDDSHSWRNNWPMRGRTDYPLIFDRNMQPKSVYQEILALPDN